MFTFGIFTTHFPYIAMVAFYAYFLLFGVNKVNEGTVKVAESSHAVQIHIDNSIEQAPADTFSFYSALFENIEIDGFEIAKVKQKWKHFGVDKIFPKDLIQYNLFSRPPPFLA